MLKLALLLNPIYVTFFWAVVLSFHTKETHIPKAFLAKFMIIGCLLYASHFVFFLPLPGIYHYIDSFYNLFSLMLYPMYYIYIRLLTVDKSFEFKKHYIYFIVPFSLFILYGGGVVQLSKDQHIFFLYEVLPKKLISEGIYNYQKGIYYLCRIAFVLQGFVYLYLSNRKIAHNTSNIQHFYTNTDTSNMTKIYILNSTLFLMMIAGIILSVIGKESFLSNSKMLIYPSIVLTAFFFIIGLLGNIQKPTVIQLEDETTNLNHKLSDNNSPHLKPIRKKLEQLFEIEKIYLNKDLNLWDVSRKIGTNRTYISMIINNDFNTSFSGFVNLYRVKYAKKILEENSLINNQDLAEISGFGSVVSMQRAFQQFEGKSISQLKEAL